MKLRSYAKVNLWLRVAGKRDDGFHDIETMFHTVSLHDELSIEATRGETEIMMTPPPGIAREGLPDWRDNITRKAVNVLHTFAPSTTQPTARIRVRKDIPIAAGLAGGSGNAAAVLRALKQLWGEPISDEDVMTSAAILGSDVPFMLHGGTMIGRGRGEILEPLANPPSLWFVLGISHQPLSTAEVYGHWRPSEGPAPSLDEFRGALETREPTVIALALRNDLEAAACELRPELVPSKQALIAAGALGALVSGSGPTVFGIAIDEQHAQDIAEGVRGDFDRVEVVRSHPRGVEVER